MSTDLFAQLLVLYMRRIRASAAGVAAEIGISREAVNNWRNGLSLPSPKNRNRLIDCARYLRLTEAETNRLFGAAGFELEYPLESSSSECPFSSYIDGLFEQLGNLRPYPISLLLAQAHWGQPPFRQELLERARSLYGERAVLHIQPPYSVSTASANYFAAIGRQCGFSDVASDYEFESALEQRLLAGERIFCLVSRFEQGTTQLRETLAGILRSLSEMHSGRLHLLLCGGEGLADLKYRSGDLSLLNIAQVNHWPELTESDLLLIGQRRCPGQRFSSGHLALLLEHSGGHPALAEEGLQWLADHPESAASGAALAAFLAGSARLWQAFLPMSETAEGRARLAELLKAEDLGRARPYLQDHDLRRLFWSNLLTVRGEGTAARLQWRSDVVRNAGRQVVDACCEN
ncbi:MAG: helix-turn-helix transcriptional regulator [Pseudomonas sp.]|uniref:helix-turn-helix domain-containing protein n=1 Tax=Pseudomonas sp. TaxID=306 RepID=UPI0033962009